VLKPSLPGSGCYIGHAESRDFNVGKVAEDQLQDLAARSSQDITLVRRSLASML
jgi:5-methyltetrahydrofolate--homocysteine methyltransferase